MKKYLAALTSILLLQCGTRHQDDLLGTWKIDSAYSFYNGFGHIHYDMAVEPELDFQPDGKVKMTIKEESRYQRFQLIQPDTLVLSSEDGSFGQKYLVVALDKGQLILKEKKKPLFKEGGNQERYELRYFSRVTH